MAEAALAEYSLLIGKYAEAIYHSDRAAKALPKGSPVELRMEDVRYRRNSSATRRRINKSADLPDVPGWRSMRRRPVWWPILEMTMRFALLASAMFAVLVTLGPAVARADEQPLTDKQQEAIKKLVHDYLMEHPETIMEAVQAYREKERLAAEDAAKKAVVARHDQLTNDPTSPVVGNPDGDVTVVEFFDYHCPYCKAMSDNVLDMVNTDGKVRLIMKELPILGAEFGLRGSRGDCLSASTSLHRIP